MSFGINLDKISKQKKEINCAMKNLNDYSLQNEHNFMRITLNVR